MKADSVSVTRKVKIARGQLDGILKMIDEDRYCIDIATQLMAATSVLKKATKEVLEAHIRSCVKDSSSRIASWRLNIIALSVSGCINQPANFSFPMKVTVRLTDSMVCQNSSLFIQFTSFSLMCKIQGHLTS